MLRSLSIRNLVLIERLDLDFGPGLCVLTGETGAGKSILLDALGLALGARGEATLVRTGAKQAAVAAAFELDPGHPALALAEEHGIEATDELVLRRTLGADGRGRGFVNDTPVSVSLLRNLGGALIEIEGQAERGGLLDPAVHREMLDGFGGLAKETGAVTVAHEDWRAALRQRDEATAALEQARRDEDYLRHVVAELDGLAPRPGEEAALAAERARLINGQKLADALAAAGAEFSDEGSAAERLRAARHTLARVADLAAGHFDAALGSLERAAIEAAEAEAAVAEAARTLALDRGQLEATEERLFALRAAARKHQTDADSLVALRDRFAASLAALEDGEDRAGRLAEAAQEAARRYGEAAKRLGRARVKAARKLDAAVGEELKPLRLANAAFRTAIEPLDEARAGPHGRERIHFEVSTNPGGPAGPLQKIASGGERARLLLALKLCLARANRVPTLIFDEVDRGIGGAVADAVGERLARLAAEVQVLVVTHSPQVAARAAHHLRVVKRTTGKITRAGVDTLSADDRREEIARMLSGARITDEARAAAESLMGDQGR